MGEMYLMGIHCSIIVLLITWIVFIHYIINAIQTGKEKINLTIKNRTTGRKIELINIAVPQTVKELFLISNIGLFITIIIILLWLPTILLLVFYILFKIAQDKATPQ